MHVYPCVCMRACVRMYVCIYVFDDTFFTGNYDFILRLGSHVVFSSDRYIQVIVMDRWLLKAGLLYTRHINKNK